MISCRGGFSNDFRRSPAASGEPANRALRRLPNRVQFKRFPAKSCGAARIMTRFNKKRPEANTSGTTFVAVPPQLPHKATSRELLKLQALVTGPAGISYWSSEILLGKEAADALAMPARTRRRLSESRPHGIVPSAHLIYIYYIEFRVSVKGLSVMFRRKRAQKRRRACCFLKNTINPSNSFGFLCIGCPRRAMRFHRNSLSVFALICYTQFSIAQAVQCADSESEDENNGYEEQAADSAV